MPFRDLKPYYKNRRDLKIIHSILNTPDLVLGFSTPQQRNIVKKLVSEELQGLNENQVWKFWESFWQNGKSFEEKNLALLFWSDRKHFALAKVFHQQLLDWASDINCWAYSDSLSSLYSRFLEDLGTPIDNILKQWNTDPNPWLRRQSIVSLLYYTRERKKLPSAQRVLTATKTLLDAPEYYVQKGVGWTLREVYQVDRTLTSSFLEKHLHKIHPAAYSAAVEKVPASQKLKWKTLRSIQRKKAKSK